MAKTNYVLLSEFSGSGEYSNRSAEVLRTVGLESNYYGIRMISNGESLSIEWYPNHSESYAESAAENFVIGVKNYEG
jgi:hypothetical protein